MVLTLQGPRLTEHVIRIWETQNTRRISLGKPPKKKKVYTADVSKTEGFATGSIHVGFVVGKVALRQVFLRVLWFSPVSIIPPSLSRLISSGECVIC
jgi:hypothetical protein